MPRSQLFKRCIHNDFNAYSNKFKLVWISAAVVRMSRTILSDRNRLKNSQSENVSSPYHGHGDYIKLN